MWDTDVDTLHITTIFEVKWNVQMRLSDIKFAKRIGTIHEQKTKQRKKNSKQNPDGNDTITRCEMLNYNLFII